MLTERLALLEASVARFDRGEPARGGDEADAASAQHDRELSGGLRERKLADIAALRRAIERHEAGLADECEDCGDGIPAARRLHMPTATRCIGCQTKAEAASRLRGQRERFARFSEEEEE